MFSSFRTEGYHIWNGSLRPMLEFISALAEALIACGVFDRRGDLMLLGRWWLMEMRRVPVMEWCSWPWDDGEVHEGWIVYLWNPAWVE